MRPSLRVQVLATVLLMSAVAALATAAGTARAGLIAALVVLALAGPAVRTLAWVRGCRAVRSIEWASDGCWRIKRGCGQLQEVQLDGASCALGPWVLLIWSGGGPRAYALLDGACGPVDVFRLLKGRLRLDAAPAIGPDSDNC